MFQRTSHDPPARFETVCSNSLPKSEILSQKILSSNIRRQYESLIRLLALLQTISLRGNLHDLQRGHVLWGKRNIHFLLLSNKFSVCFPSDRIAVMLLRNRNVLIADPNTSHRGEQSSGVLSKQILTNFRFLPANPTPVPNAQPT